MINNSPRIVEMLARQNELKQRLNIIADAIRNTADSAMMLNASERAAIMITLLGAQNHIINAHRKESL